jgi:hypothetical protein
MLGSRVDAALSDFFPIRMRRAKLRLAGNSGNIPELCEMFFGQSKLIGETVKRARTTFDKATGKLNHRLLHHASDVVMPDGNKVRQISIDARDISEIPKIIRRERKRSNLPPLSEEMLADAAKKFTVNTIENPLMHISLSISFAYLRHAMIKIAYELAFMWLGDFYLEDPLAVELREAICNPDLASTDNIKGYVGFANEEQFAVFESWTPHEEHHLVFSSVVAGSVIVAVRLFDIYAAAIVVSQEAHRYFRTASDSTKLRFIAIDAVSGNTINTTVYEEFKRIETEMTKHRRIPPFPDPLSPNIAPE